MLACLLVVRVLMQELHLHIQYCQGGPENQVDRKRKLHCMLATVHACMHAAAITADMIIQAEYK